MPGTTTAQNACAAEVHLDDINGVQQDISGSSSSVTPAFTQKLGEYEVFTEDWMNRLCCGRDATITINAVYSTANNEAWDVLRDWLFSPTGSCAARTLTLYIPDKNVGSDRIQGEFRLESLDFPVDRGQAEPIPVTAVLRPDGTVTHSTAAT